MRWSGGIAAQVEEEHVGRWIEAAQSAVDAEGLGLGPASQALGGDDLKDVASSDILFGPAHGGLELVLRQVRATARRPAARVAGAVVGSGACICARTASSRAMASS